MAKTFSWSLLVPIALYLLAPFIVSKDTALWVNVLFSMALVVPLGPMLYLLVYKPVAEASVLVLLIISVAVPFALTGLALVFFGAAGWRTPTLRSEVRRVGHECVSTCRSRG